MDDSSFEITERRPACSAKEIVAIAAKIRQLNALQTVLVHCIVDGLSEDEKVRRIRRDAQTVEKMFFSILNTVGIPLELPVPVRQTCLIAAAFEAFGIEGRPPEIPTVAITEATSVEGEESRVRTAQPLPHRTEPRRQFER